MERQATGANKHVCLVTSAPQTWMTGNPAGLLGVLGIGIRSVVSCWFPGHGGRCKTYCGPPALGRKTGFSSAPRLSFPSAAGRCLMLPWPITRVGAQQVPLAGPSSQPSHSWPTCQGRKHQDHKSLIMWVRTHLVDDARGDLDPAGACGPAPGLRRSSSPGLGPGVVSPAELTATPPCRPLPPAILYIPRPAPLTLSTRHTT